MKAAKGSIPRVLDQPDPMVRLYLFYGPDDAQSRALADRLAKALGAARFVVPAAAIRSDAALLADEAGAMSLFGGPRAIWVEPAGDEIAAGVEALLATAQSESPVILIAGALRKTSALLKLAEAHPHTLAHASYTPEGQQAERMVIDLGRTYGLRIANPVAARIADACANDQAVVAQELAKLALYLDAMPESPKDLDHEAVDAAGAAIADGGFLRLSDLALSGQLAELADELSRLPAGGSEAVPVVRSLQRRLLMIAPMRARVESGESTGGVMASLGKALFWKDKPIVEQLLNAWDAGDLATLAERLGKVERQSMLSAAPASAALGEELVAIARAARRR